MPPSRIEVVEGDLLDQPVEAIVNPWNRNVIPWWLLLPQGVSGAVRRRAGREPFRQLGRMGPIRLGEAVATTAGRLPFRAIIHVAGINLLWRSSEASIRTATRNAVALAGRLGLHSIALPLIGAGTGGACPERVLEWMREELSRCDFQGTVRIVRFAPKSSRGDHS